MKSCIRKIHALTLLLCLSVLFTGCGMRTVKLTATDTGMGTVVQKTLYVNDENTGNEILKEIEECIVQYEKEVLSWRIEGSEIARINESAGSEQGSVLSKQMEALFSEIWNISEKSGGALDVTVGQITEVWNLDKWAVLSEEEKQNFKAPSDEEIRTLLEHVGYEKIKMQNGCIYIPEGMKLDLGAVGKGIVCDKIGAYLREQTSVTGAVISLGGSVLTYGTKSDGNPWQIAITHPRESGSYLGTISLKGEYYVATSGDYERYVEVEKKRFHHIINPATGYPVDNEVCSVTIVSKSGLVSDALSTACFVLGVEEGILLAEELGAQALFVTKDLEIIMTEGMKQYFTASQ